MISIKRKTFCCRSSHVTMLDDYRGENQSPSLHPRPAQAPSVCCLGATRTTWIIFSISSERFPAQFPFQAPGRLVWVYYIKVIYMLRFVAIFYSLLPIHVPWEQGYVINIHIIVYDINLHYCYNYYRITC